MIGSVIPSRMDEAREGRALSREDLAESIGVTRQSISKYEHGITNPSLEVLQRISIRLDFPLEFFYKAETACAADGSSLFFRSKSGITKKVKKACRYQIKWTQEIKNQLETYVDFVQQNLPVTDKNYEELTLDDVEDIAMDIRSGWGLNGDPIGDLIGVLENQGVIVAQLAVNTLCNFRGVDAFSCWENGTPYILYNPDQKSAVRIRFSILHELGHLILHSAISQDDSVTKEIIDRADEQADRFAAAFLLPNSTFSRDVHGSSIGMFEQIKKKWGASIAAMIKRCADLHLLTDNQINYLYRQMSTKKYWHKEPLDDILTISPPEILRDAIYLLIDNGIFTKTTFINSSAMSTKDLKNICGLPDSFFEEVEQRRKPILRVVGS